MEKSEEIHRNTNEKLGNKKRKQWKYKWRLGNTNKIRKDIKRTLGNTKEH